MKDGGRGTRDAQELLMAYDESLQPAAQCKRGFWRLSNGLPFLSAAADAPINGPVEAAALRPPLAALPLTAAAYPLRVLGGPFPRNLHAIHGPFFQGPPFYWCSSSKGSGTRPTSWSRVTP